MRPAPARTSAAAAAAPPPALATQTFKATRAPSWLVCSPPWVYPLLAHPSGPYFPSKRGDGPFSSLSVSYGLAKPAPAPSGPSAADLQPACMLSALSLRVSATLPPAPIMQQALSLRTAVVARLRLWYCVAAMALLAPLRCGARLDTPRTSCGPRQVKWPCCSDIVFAHPHCPDRDCGSPRSTAMRHLGVCDLVTYQLSHTAGLVKSTPTPNPTFATGAFDPPSCRCFLVLGVRSRGAPTASLPTRRGMGQTSF